MTTVISIVSGKGGAGKSLLTAVLGRAIAREGKRVLLVDMDIFVRGLTIILFGYKRPERKDNLITVSDLLGVFSTESQSRQPVANDSDRYMIERFFECDVLPAVDNISAPLDYDDRSLSDEEFCDSCIKRLVSSLEDKYEYILLDSRAGMDSLIAASCKNAQIVLAVAEDDEVGKQTNANLVRFLNERKKVRVVYSVINKGRNIRSYVDVKDRLRQRSEFAMLGVIPFDLDVLEDFGTDRFWASIMETLYFRAMIDAWNTLAKSELVTEIAVSKYKFPPRIFMQESQGRYTLFQRMLRLYSILFIAAGSFAWMYGQFRFEKIDPFQFFAVVSVLVGVVSLVLSTSNFQSLLRGRDILQDETRRDR